MRKRTALVMLVAVVAGLLLLQLVPVARTNPPATGTIAAPPETMAVLRRACFDCHSNETVWPWYSRVAPISFLVASDTTEGRRELNFSTWDKYDAATKLKLLRKSWKETAKGEMPMWIYRVNHPEARLSPADLAVLQAWLTSVAPPLPPGVR